MAPVRVTLVEGDITRERVDAIVNAANSGLLGGGGVDGAIHRAGGPAVLAECRRLRASTLPDGLPVGEAVATTAGKLPARWVVHTVGPRWTDREDRSPLLRGCYASSLRVADDLAATTIAFPLVSAGVYGWPFDDAVRQALTVLRAATPRHLTEARLVLYGTAAHRAALDIAATSRSEPEPPSLGSATVSD